MYFMINFCDTNVIIHLNPGVQIEIDLDPEYRYHSMFACPILRQPSSESNPPMRLICGHTISKDALHKLGTPNKYVKSNYYFLHAY